MKRRDLRAGLSAVALGAAFDDAEGALALAQDAADLTWGPSIRPHAL